MRILRVRLKITRNARIKTIGKYELCMVSKLPIVFKRTRTTSSTAIAQPKVMVITMASWKDAGRNGLPDALRGACDFVVTTDGSVPPSFEIGH